MSTAGNVDDLRDNDGWIAQGTYTWNGITKLGVSYGISSQDETTGDSNCRTTGFADAAGTIGCSSAASIDQRKLLTVGVYHDMTSWLKLVAEYSYVDHEWHNGADQDANIFAVGGFFFW
jgi:hypothetical protein